MKRGVHGEKLAMLLENSKLSESDKLRAKKALAVYDSWVKELNTLRAKTLDGLI